MTDYTLNIQIDQSGVQTISGLRMSVALIQPQANADYQIVAVLSKPANDMQITWTSALSVYTSNYALQAYTLLKINSYGSALSGQVFKFDGSTISETGSTSLPQTVQLTNSSGAPITSGLARTFAVNGNEKALAITSASSLLNSGLGTFPIADQVLLTVMSGAEVGMALPKEVLPNLSIYSRQVAPQISGQPPLLIDFSASTTSQTVHFDDESATFRPGELT